MLVNASRTALCWGVSSILVMPASSSNGTGSPSLSREYALYQKSKTLPLQSPLAEVTRLSQRRSVNTWRQSRKYWGNSSVMRHAYPNMSRPARVG